MQKEEDKMDENEKKPDIEIFTCHKCCQSFRTESHFAEHIKLCLQKSQLETTIIKKETEQCVTCDLCKVVFDSVEEQSQHLTCKHNINHKCTPICSKCCKLFHKHKDLKVDIATHEKQFECKLCSIRFETAPDLWGHMIITHKTYKCSKCDTLLGNQVDFSNHLLAHEQELICYICNAEFAKAEHLWVHMTCIHPVPTMTCTKCGTNAISDLKLHQAVCKGTNDLDKKETKRQLLVQVKTQSVYKNFDHSYSNLAFKYTATEESATPSQSTHKQYECYICKELYSDLYTFRLHQHFHTQKKCLQCIFCGTRYYKVVNLFLHMNTHTGNDSEKPYKCDLCNATFYLEKHRARHMRLKHRETYECDCCDATFCIEKQKAKHMQIEHTGKCDYCDVNFEETLSKTTHMKTHFDPPLHKCPHCDLTFSLKQNLKSHLYDLHTLICPDCGVYYKTTEDLFTHRSIEHRQKDEPWLT